MPYELSQAEKAEITALYNAAVAAGATTLGAWAPVYARLDQMLTASTGGPVTGVDQNVWVWVAGAQSVNAGEGGFGAVIRNYTAVQHKLRYGIGIDEVEEGRLNRASNEIAQKFVEDVLEFGVPDIGDTGLIDAGPVAARIFDANFSPWAGTIFFAFLGHDQFFRDWVLTLDTSEEKKEKGTYDLIAAAQSIQDTASVGNIQWDTARAALFSNWPTDTIKQDTNNWFKQTYGITEAITVGDDVFGLFALATNWLKSAHYAVGTYGDDTISTSPGPNGITGTVYPLHLMSDITTIPAWRASLASSSPVIRIT